MAETITLPARLDLPAAQDLVNTLNATKAEDEITIDASDVTHLGALCTQALLAASTRANAAGGAILIENLSERVEEQLGHMGLSPEKLMEGAA